MKTEQEIYLAVLGDTNLKHHHKNLYLYLLWLSGQEDSRKKGGVFAGNEHLSKQLGSPIRNIKDWVTQLEKMGLISRSMKNNKRVITVNPYSANGKPSNHRRKTVIEDTENRLTIDGKPSIQDTENRLDNIDVNTNTNTDGNIEEEQAPPLAADLLPLTDKDEDYIEDFTYYWRKLGTNLRDHYQRLPRDQRDKLYKFVMDNMKELNSRKLELTTVIQNKLWTIDKYNQWFDQNLLTRLPSNVPVEKKESSFILG